jgi:peptidoglycan/LPS O-acetylase OafA/YrhL
MATPRPAVQIEEWARPPRIREAVELRQYRLVTGNKKRRRAGRDLFFLLVGFVLASMMLIHR